MCGIWAVFGSDYDLAFQKIAADKIQHRGPDGSYIENVACFPGCLLAFHHLAINDKEHGKQPMRLSMHPDIILMLNGEIYNASLLQEQFGFKYTSRCDVEAVIHLYAAKGIEFAAKHLDGVFAFCLIDTGKRQVYVVRDTFGVKPAFKIYNRGFLAVSSEGKGLISFFEKDSANQIYPLLPGHIEEYSIDFMGKATFQNRSKFYTIRDMPIYKTLCDPDASDLKKNIRMLLQNAVSKRLMSDRRIGCLLSGGLDSSLVTAIFVRQAKKLGLPYPIQTFCTGMEGCPDIEAARKVANHLGTEHHEVSFTAEEGIAAINDAIYHLESYDVVTVRPSVGMYLLCKYIKQNTDTTVILSGEGSDEIAQGYLFFHKAATAQEADEESRRMSKNLYMYDVLRADRITSAWGLELRVPFLDRKFSCYYLSQAPEKKMPRYGIEKYQLRSAFDELGYVPKDILWRPKEGFSDGISSVKKSWFEVIKEFVDQQISDKEYHEACSGYSHNQPTSKEALYYRKTFEKMFPGLHCAKWIPYQWMPKWVETSDPSARFLEIYKERNEIAK